MVNNQYSTIVLVVDDTPINLQVLFDTLQQAHYKTLVAQDGISAIEQVSKLKPDIILLDVHMPGIDGFETCRRLKSNPNTNHIPVIFLTASTETVDKVRGFDVGGVDYLTKPIDPPEVLARINTHLTLRNLREQLEVRNEELSGEVSTYATDLQSEVEKRRLYQRERQELLHNVSQQSESIQQLAAQVMAEHRQQNQLLGQNLQQDIAANLNLLQAMLIELDSGLNASPPAPPEPLVESLEQGLLLLSQTQQQLQQIIKRLILTSSTEQKIWATPLESLSQREREVLRLIAQSKTHQEIGNLLNISPKTVGVYRWRIMRKLNVENVTGLIKLTLKYNLID